MFIIMTVRTLVLASKATTIYVEAIPTTTSTIRTAILKQVVKRPQSSTPSSNFSDNLPLKSDIKSCKETFSTTSIIELSFKAHIKYIRRGVSRTVVKQYYDFALKQMTDSKCICDVNMIDVTCVHDHFAPQVGNASLDLWWMIADDSAKTIKSDRAFPNLLNELKLPQFVDEMQQLAIEQCKRKTLRTFNIIVAKGFEEKALNTKSTAMVSNSDITSLPEDEIIFVELEHDKVCEKHYQRVSQYTITSSSSAITSYVIGAIQQLAIISGHFKSDKLKEGTHKVIEDVIKEHVDLVYTAGRCKRLNNKNLQIPIDYLYDLVLKTELAKRTALLTTSTTLLQGLPSLNDISLIASIGRKFFPQLIDRFSSLSSGGSTKYITWTGSNVVIEDVSEIVLRNSSVKGVEVFSHQMRVYNDELNPNCGIEYTWVQRIQRVMNWYENCCDPTCVWTVGGLLKNIHLTFLNEMCCQACNAITCDVVRLSHVKQIIRRLD